MPDGVVNIIAEKVTTNVREMEGLLTKVISYASLTGRSADDPYVINEAFKDFSDDRREMITVDRIIECVCEFYKVTREDLVGKKKIRKLSNPDRSAYTSSPNSFPCRSQVSDRYSAAEIIPQSCTHETK